MADEKLEPYQEKLLAFIAKVPMDPLEIKSGTPELAKPTKAQVEPLENPVPPNKGAQTNKDFSDLTGMTQLQLLKNWADGGIMTSCNSFVGQCGIKMGMPAKSFSVGQFEIAKVLYNNGLGHLWVPASSGARPRVGDVFKPNHTHMGVSLHFDGDMWNTVEGGQGGKSKGYDSVKRKQKSWSPESLEGWVNMAGLLAAAGKIVPQTWLGGWWRIVENGTQEYYYHFHASGAVSFTPMPPSTPFSMPVNPSMQGSFRMFGYTDVLISWNGPDVDEHFQRAWQTDKKKPEHMIGIKESKGRFTAEKLGVPAIVGT